MQLTIEECTALLNVLDGVVNPKDADLITDLRERVRVVRERLRLARNSETYTRIWEQKG